MDNEQLRLTTSPASGIRASDADRERMVELLRAHHLEGRLDASEFQERLERSLQAKTLGELRALSADLPALRPLELSRALKAAAAWPNAFVPDAAGDGTTLYTAAPGAAFRPAFGGASRSRHAAGGAAELDLDAVPGLRRDVDTPADLRDAVALGLGPRTAPLAAELLRCAPQGR